MLAIRLPKNFINLYIHKIKKFIKKYKLEKGTHRYSLINVTSKNDNIELHIIVLGIKKHIVTFKPEDVVYDDELLSEFSPCDVRTITYLSFQKYIQREQYSLMIERQSIINGKTVFIIKDLNTKESLTISAKKLYEDYASLIKLSKKDMVNVVSTAVQEQTFLDLQKIGIL